MTDEETPEVNKPTSHPGVRDGRAEGHYFSKWLAKYRVCLHPECTATQEMDVSKA